MAFREGVLQADGFDIRYLDAGEGTPLVHLHGSGGPRLTRAHDLLSERHRVVAFEMPGFGMSAANTRTQSTAELGATMGAAIRALGIGSCDLLATSFGARVALWLAVGQPELVRTLVLEAPAAIRPDGVAPPIGSPEEIARLIYAHPDRLPPRPPLDPAIQAKTRALVTRLWGPDRDAELERRMQALAVPTLVLFGTHDRLTPPELGRYYKELLPNGHLVFVYDAAHAIGAERPEAFVDVVQDFIERREAFVISRTDTRLHP